MLLGCSILRSNSRAKTVSRTEQNCLKKATSPCHRRLTRPCRCRAATAVGVVKFGRIRHVFRHISSLKIELTCCKKRETRTAWSGYRQKELLLQKVFDEVTMIAIGKQECLLVAIYWAITIYDSEEYLKVYREILTNGRACSGCRGQGHFSRLSRKRSWSLKRVRLALE